MFEESEKLVFIRVDMLGSLAILAPLEKKKKPVSSPVYAPVTKDIIEYLVEQGNGALEELDEPIVFEPPRERILLPRALVREDGSVALTSSGAVLYAGDTNIRGRFTIGSVEERVVLTHRLRVWSQELYVARVGEEFAISNVLEKRVTADVIDTIKINTNALVRALENVSTARVVKRIRLVMSPSATLLVVHAGNESIVVNAPSLLVDTPDSVMAGDVYVDCTYCFPLTVVDLARYLSSVGRVVVPLVYRDGLVVPFGVRLAPSDVDVDKLLENAVAEL